MIKSMTGFGRGKSTEGQFSFAVEIKTVNHRYSDIFVKMPREISFVEDIIREKVGRCISRGKIDVCITFEDFGNDAFEITIDDNVAKQYIKALKSLQDRFDLNGDITVEHVSKFPELLRVTKKEKNQEVVKSLLSEALDSAMEELVDMRKREGERLKTDILDKLLNVENILKDISDKSQTVVEEYRKKLTQRISELLIDKSNLDEGRIEVEVAFFADKCSIDEELVRLMSHIKQFREILNDGQPIGRKLDFLVQEMNREINTVGSKSNNLAITRCVVDIKSELEKIREQVQNIE